MNTLNQSETFMKMNRQALLMFGGLAIAVFCIAFAYCYITNHLFEATIVAVVMFGLEIFIGSIYTSIGKKLENPMSEIPLKQAA